MLDGAESQNYGYGYGTKVGAEHFYKGAKIPGNVKSSKNITKSFSNIKTKKKIV